MRYRTHAAAEYLGVSPRTLEKWRVIGGGPPFSKLGGAVVYDQTTLDTFLRERIRTSTSERPEPRPAA